MFDVSYGGNKTAGGSGYLFESGMTGTSPSLLSPPSNLFVGTVVVCNLSPKLAIVFGLYRGRSSFVLPTVGIAFVCVVCGVGPLNRLAIVGEMVVVVVAGGTKCDGVGRK